MITQLTHFFKIRFNIALAVLFFFFIGVINNATAQVSVTATLGTVGPTSYLTLSQAFSAINSGTHKGAIIITITGTVNETAVTSLLNGVTAPASYSSISIKPSGDASILMATPGANRAIIELQGADNVTIDGDDTATAGIRNLTVAYTSTAATAAAVIRVSSNSATGTDGASNNTIKNCILTGNRVAGGTTATYGINMSNYSATSLGSGGASSINNTFENNLITRVYHGIWASGVATYYNTGLRIRNNILGDGTQAGNIGTRGILISNSAIAADATSAIISGNDIQGGDPTGAGYSATVAGIEIGTQNTGIQIYNNNIHDIRQPSVSGFGALGIYVTGSAGNTSANIYNNVIRDMVASFYTTSATLASSTYGILFTAGATNYAIDHNTIVLKTSPTTGLLTTTAISACINMSVAGVTLSSFRNNIIVNTISTTASYGLYCAATTNIPAINLINNNNYYVATGAVGFYSAAAQTTLSSWKTATGKDANAQNINPTFVSATDMHISPSPGTLLESGGVAIATITTDYEGQTRPGPFGSVNGGGTAPDIGADEFDGFIPGCSSVPGTLSTGVISSTTAVINWNAAAIAPGSGYEYYYSTSSTAPTTTITGTVAAGVTTVSLSGLTANTTYYFWVRSKCDATFSSGWTGPISFTTTCVPVSLNITQGFNALTIPSCWSQQYVSGTSNLSYPTGSALPATTPQEGTNYVYWSSSTFASGNQTRLVSPPIFTTGVPSVDVQFQWFHDNTNYTTAGYADEGVYVEYSTNGTSWTIVGAEITRLGGVNGWNLKTITLPAGAANQPLLYVGFRFVSRFGYNCSMDAVDIHPTPACSAQPSLLSTSSITSTTATISWTAASPVPALGYEYYYSTSSITPTTTISGSVANTILSASLSGLTVGTTYYFWVRSRCDATTTSLWAGASSFTTSSPCTSAPSVLISSAIASTTATISWTAASPAPVSGYEYFVSTSATAPLASATPTGNVAAGVLSASLIGLTPNITYYFWVRSLCSTGNASAWTASANFTTSCGSSFVTTVASVNETFNTTSPTITCWLTQANISGTAAAPLLATVGTNPTTSPQEGDRMIYFNSFSISSGGQSRLISMPLNTSGATSVDVDFYWRNENNTSYTSTTEGVQVQYSTNGGSTWTNIGSFISRHDGTLTAGTAQWKLKNISIGAAGVGTNIRVGFLFTSQFGDNCFLDNVTVKQTPACAQQPSALNASAITATSATIGWTAASPAPASGYEYYLSTSSVAPTSATAPTNSVGASVTTASLSILSSNTTYYVWVRSNCNATDKSTWVGPINFTTLLACAQQPSALTSSLITSTGARISWTAASPAPSSGYEYYLSTSSVAPAFSAAATGSVGAGVTIVNLTGLTPNTTYYVWIRSNCNGTDKSLWVGYVSFLTGYCPSTSTGISYYINSLITSAGVANINNVTNAISASGYGNFLSQIASNYQGTPTNFSLNWNTTGGVGIGLWIDWNNDLDFADANEAVYVSSAYNFTTSYSGVINIPVGVAVGSYRMRVKIDYNSTAPNSCGSISGGETEDYTFNVLASTACSGTPAPGNTNASPAIVVVGGSSLLSLQNSTTGVGVTYQWQSSSDNTTWTNITGATSSTYTATVSANTYFRCIVTCSGLNGTSASKLVSVTYCTSTSTGTTYFINGFTTTGGVTNIANITNAISANGYGDFTTLSASQFQGGTVNFNTDVSAGGDYGLAIYIDWNNDYDFADAGEKVYTSNAYLLTPITGSFVVPAGQAIRGYRMRVVANYLSTAPAACNSMSSGETEDYTFNVLASAACTGTPAPGNTIASPASVAVGGTTILSLQNATAGSGVNYQWQSSTNNSTWINITGATNATYSVTLNISTYYRCIVTCGATPGPSASVLVTVTYCNSTSTGTIYFINSFTTTGAVTNINNVTNAISANGYGNFTAQSASQYQGSAVSFNTGVSAGGDYGLAIFIDWNNDLDFADAGENVFTTTAYLFTPIPGSFTVPLAQAVGNYRMRVVANYLSTAPSACNSMSSGETEDYTFSVLALSPCTGTPDPGATIASPASVAVGGTTLLSLQNVIIGSGITYQWQSSPDNATWTNITGATRSTYTATVNSITYFQCIVTCSGNNGTSTPVLVSITYCTSTSTGTTYFINGFTTTGGILNINNQTNAISANGYGNFTAQSASQFPSATLNFSTAVSAGGSYGLAIFVDWNNDFDFADAGETVYATNSYLFTPIAGSFVVPALQTAGNYRMRVVVNYFSTTPAACNAMASGETEDYTLAVLALSPCAGTPVGGSASSIPSTGSVSTAFSLNITGSTAASGITYQWQSSPDGTTSWTDIPGATSVPATVTSVATITTTYYRLKVTCTNGGAFAYSSTTTFITSYCLPTYTAACSSNDYVNNFTLNTISNLNSGCNANANNYILYPTTSFTTTLVQGVTYNATVGIGRGGSGNVAIWLDFNNNAVFEPSERFSNTVLIPLSGTVTIPILIPVSLTGNIRLRVREVYNATTVVALDPCANYSYGETEDYIVNIIANTPCTGTPVPGNTISNVTSLCEGGSVNFSLQNLLVNAGISFQWQSSTDNITYSNVAGGTGANTANYSAAIASTTWYRCAVTCAGNIGYSTPIQITTIVCTTMPLNRSTTISTCASNFYDTGGILGNYTNNELDTLIILPSTLGSLIRLTFNEFDIEPGYDFMRIYNGSTVNAPLIGVYSAATPGVITSSAANGALTIVFTSDGSVAYTGWDATVSCYVPPPCTGTPIPGATLNSNVLVCIPGYTSVLSLQNAIAGSGVVYQWQSAPDAAGVPGAFTNIVLNASSPTYTYAPTVATVLWFKCIVTCSGSSGISVPVQVTSSACTIVNMPVNDSIVTCSALFFDSGGSGGSTSATNIAGNYTDGETRRLTIKPATVGAKIRVSFNSFAVETCCDNLKIYDGNSAASLLLGSFTSNPGVITSTASDGSLTFVFTSDGITNRAGWDATVSCFVPPPCAGTPVAGAATTFPSTGSAGTNFTLNATGVSANSGLIYQWQTSPDATNWTNVPGATTLPSTIPAPGVSGVISTTYYRLMVTCTNSGQSSYSTTASFITADYCTPTSTTANSYYINKISFLGTIQDITNTSTYSSISPGFQDFSGLPLKSIQAQGEGINLYIQCNDLSYMIAWVDWNNSGAFEPSEQVYSSGAIRAYTTTFGFVIPLSTSPGNYRIRIRSTATSSLFDACANLANGEAEDYLFTVVATCPINITSVTSGQVCGSGPVNLSVTATPGATQYNWYAVSSGGIPIANTNDPNWTTPSIFRNTIYYVTASNGTCESIIRTAIKANLATIPILSFLPNNPIICGEGAVLKLNATGDIEEVVLVNENFESGLGAFTVNNIINNSFTPNTQWTSKTSTYVPTNTAVWRPAVSSGVGINKFAFSTSDFSGASVNTALVSPQVNTTGFTDLFMDFSIYYSHYLADGNVSGTDSVLIEASTNGGTSWARVDYYIDDQGIGTRFSDNSINLSAYINYPSLLIRFRYNAYWSDGIAIDDVRLVGYKPLTSTFSWSPINQNNLFTDSTGLVPYTGGSIPNVYIRPTLGQLDTAVSLTFTATATLSNGCSASAPVTISIIPSQWTGTAGTNWNDVNNWCSKAVPSQTTKVEIPAGLTNYPIINSAAYGANIKIFTGGSLTITDLGSLAIKGAFDNNGTLTNNGRIELNGSALQNFPGSGVINAMSILHLNNTGPGVVLNKSINIDKELRPTSGLFNIGNYDVTIKSSLIRTASVSKVGATSGFNYGTGRFIVERYIPSGINHGKSWQLLATPTNDGQTINNSWQEGAATPNANPVPGFGTQITSDIANATTIGFDVFTAPGPSMKYFNSLTNWTGVGNTLTTPIYNSHGYMIFVRGDRSVINLSGANSTSIPTILRTRGKLFVTGANPPPTIPITAGKFESVGNPYASAIDFSNPNGVIFNGPPNVDNLFYVWDPTLGGAYGYGGYQTISGLVDWVPNPGGTTNYPSGANSKIQSGQAFLMHGGALGGSVTFAEEAKVDSSRMTLREIRSANVAGEKQLIKSRLFSNFNNQLALVDGNIVVMNSNLSNDYTADDAIKLINGGENFGLNSNNKIYAIEARLPAVAADTLFFATSNLKAINYKLEFVNEHPLTNALLPFLIDNYLQTTTPISLMDTTFYNFSVISNTPASAVNRFMIVFKPGQTVPVKIISIKAIRNYNNSVSLNSKVENELNINHYEIERSFDGIHFDLLKTLTPLNNIGGSVVYSFVDETAPLNEIFYRLKAIDVDNYSAYSEVVKVAAIKGNPIVTVTPNPIKGQRIQLSFNGSSLGDYFYEISNSMGQIIDFGSFQLSSSSQKISLKLGVFLSGGVYNLILKTKGSSDIILQVAAY